MNKPLTVLVVEDSEEDMLLLMRELRRAGFDPFYERVDSARAMTSALERRSWDLVISDHSLPGFGSCDALHLLRERGSDIPFIIVSGTIGEETAVQAMKAGANDYVMKRQLARLAPAIERELREVANRRARREAEEARAYLAAIVESSDDAIVGRTLDGTILSWNAGAERLYGYKAAEVKGRSIALLVPSYRPEELPQLHARIRGGERIDRYETIRVRKNRTHVDVSLTLSPIRDGTGKVVGVSAIERDITARKREEAERVKLIFELSEALGKIKTLRGLLPMCSTCMKIRDDRGHWQKVESYIAERTEAEFTPGLCPECQARLCPEPAPK